MRNPISVFFAKSLAQQNAHFQDSHRKPVRSALLDAIKKPQRK